jgi:predicted GNAT family acetyltransferase
MTWSEEFAREVGTTAPPTVQLIGERIGSGGVLLWETDRPVAMAMIVRRTPNGAAVGYVYTPGLLRGRGYASAITAAITDAELRAGRHCFLFTDADNPTSNKIYQAIGYKWVCDIEEWRFE